MFFGRKFFVAFCVENYVELWGSWGVTDHELLRSSCAGHEGSLLYAKEIKSCLGGFVCSGICSAVVKVLLLEAGTGFREGNQ